MTKEFAVRMTRLPEQGAIPPDPEGMNSARAEWAFHAIAAFRAVTETDEEDAITDLLADLRHLCDRHPERFGTFEDAMRRSQGHYNEETRSE